MNTKTGNYVCLEGSVGFHIHKTARTDKRGPHEYSDVQINMVKGCVTAGVVDAAFDHVYLDSRVLMWVSFIGSRLLVDVEWKPPARSGV